MQNDLRIQNLIREAAEDLANQRAVSITGLTNELLLQPHMLLYRKKEIKKKTRASTSHSPFPFPSYTIVVRTFFTRKTSLAVTQVLEEHMRESQNPQQDPQHK